MTDAVIVALLSLVGGGGRWPEPSVAFWAESELKGVLYEST